MRAALQVFSFKEGMLARLAHDLRLSLHDWEATLDARELSATFRLSSLRVDGVAHGGTRGRVDEHALSPSDRTRIEANLANDVLELRAHPTARYAGRIAQVDAHAVRLDGALTLHGVTQACPVELRPDGTRGAWTGEVTLAPSRFGIAPFKALGGAIRLADQVIVRVSLELADASPLQLMAAGEPLRFSPQSA